MYKQMIAVLRGTLSQQSEDFTDRHALIILKQQIRDCAAQLLEAKRAVAVAIAQNDSEAKHFKQLKEKLADLETRAIAALENEEMELAQEAAQTIAILEIERDMSKKALDQYASEIGRLRQIVQGAELKLKELNRGLKLASATDKTQKIRKNYTSATLSSFSEAENTLDRLKGRQQELDISNDILAEMDQNQDPDQLIVKLADAGCGNPIQSSAQDVLERLRSKTEAKTDNKADNKSGKKTK